MVRRSGGGVNRCEGENPSGSREASRGASLSLLICSSEHDDEGCEEVTCLILLADGEISRVFMHEGKEGKEGVWSSMSCKRLEWNGTAGGRDAAMRSVEEIADRFDMYEIDADRMETVGLYEAIEKS